MASFIASFSCVSFSWKIVSKNSLSRSVLEFSSSSYPLSFAHRRAPHPHFQPVPNSIHSYPQLFESDCIPHSYAAYMKNPSPPQTQPITEEDRCSTSWQTRDVLALPGSSWLEASMAFKQTFQTKTGIEWEDRLEPPLGLKQGEMKGEGFRYYPPKSGPLGWVRQLTLAERRAIWERKREELEERQRDGRWSGRGWVDDGNGTVVAMNKGESDSDTPVTEYED